MIGCCSLYSTRLFFFFFFVFFEIISTQDGKIQQKKKEGKKKKKKQEERKEQPVWKLWILICLLGVDKEATPTLLPPLEFQPS